MLGLRLRRRQKIKTALGQRLFFLGRDVTAMGRSRCLAWFKGAWHCFLSRHRTLTQRCSNAGPASPMLSQHWNIAWSTFLHVGFHPHPPPPAKLINLVDTAYRAIPCALSPAKAPNKLRLRCPTGACRIIDKHLTRALSHLKCSFAVLISRLEKDESRASRDTALYCWWIIKNNHTQS